MTKRSKIQIELKEAQDQLKKAMDNATLMNQIMTALTMRLIQRGGNLDMLRSVLSGIGGTERLDAMLEAVDGMTISHIVTLNRFKVTPGGDWIQQFDIRSDTLPALVSRLVPNRWNEDCETQPHVPLRLMVIGSMGVMSGEEASNLATSLAGSEAPRGYHGAHAAELISLACHCMNNRKQLERIAGKLLIGLGTKQPAGSGRSSYLALYFPREAVTNSDAKPLLLEYELNDKEVICGASGRLALYAATERISSLGGLR
jgi:hypothetical protein